MRVFGLVVTTVLVSGGCDFAFGLEDDPGPCDATSFAGATPSPIGVAESFSISRDRSTAIYEVSGMPYLASPIDAMPVPIDLGVYDDAGLALAPEGTSLFYTAMIDPPVLRGALRGASAWKLDAVVPHGTFAGTPSADEFGPRRVIVRLFQAGDAVQEYEDDDGVWTAIGDTHPVASLFAPNLTPSGLTMVYFRSSPGNGDDIPDTSGVYIATRASTAEWFGAEALILPGDHRDPQLLGACTALYTIDANNVERYDRP